MFNLIIVLNGIRVVKGITGAFVEKSLFVIQFEIKCFNEFMNERKI